MIPSSSVIIICIATEKLFRRAVNANMGKPPTEKRFPAILASQTFKQLMLSNSTIFEELDNHGRDTLTTDELIDHKHMLIKKILQLYIELRMYTFVKNYSITSIGTNIRHHLSRQIVWVHQ